MTSAVFRLLEAAGGSILIDGVDISTLGLEFLRSSLAIIPQDPVLFSGTIRSNLDPFSLYSDDQIWTALESSQLKSTVESLTLQLNSLVSEDGSNFSVGQRSQFCLARALLKTSKILIFDEATASIDQQIDAQIQQFVRNSCEGKTILCIAHRLSTIADYDTVWVLDSGEIVESDSPIRLLRNNSSVFYSMVNETGASSLEFIRSIAENAEIEREKKGKSWKRQWQRPKKSEKNLENLEIFTTKVKFHADEEEIRELLKFENQSK